jgi:hypothetical protein
VSFMTWDGWDQDQQAALDTLLAAIQREIGKVGGDEALLAFDARQRQIWDEHPGPEWREVHLRELVKMLRQLHAAQQEIAGEGWRPS